MCYETVCTPEVYLYGFIAYGLIMAALIGLLYVIRAALGIVHLIRRWL